MPTPAELLAAAHAAAQADILDDVVYDDAAAATTTAAAAPATRSSLGSRSSVSRATINDDSAFPALGTVPQSSASSASSWGPKMGKSFVSSAPSSSASSSSSSTTTTKSKSVAMRSKSIQEAFSLDFDDQLNVSKSEFANILNGLKKTTKCNIECTSSQQTKKRTFLLTGEPNEIARVRREILRRLTKPVNIVFSIPSSTRSVVIGSGGRNLKPIIESNSVKINIDRETTPEVDGEEDIFGGSVNVSIQGDIQGVNDAKAQILAIVDEHTKSLTTKLTIDSEVAPFIEGELKDLHVSDDVSLYVSPSGLVSITGPREAIVDLRNNVKILADQLTTRIITKEQNVPKKFHKFIDTQEILDDLNVVVEIPFEEEDSQVVKFIGDKNKINAAINKAKQSSQKHTIESLNIARAHNNNLDHGKKLGIYLKQSSALDPIASAHNVQIYLPSYETLLSEKTKTVTLDFVYDNLDEFKAAKKAVVEFVNKFTPTNLKTISDIDSFFAGEVSTVTDDVAKESSVAVIPFAALNTKAKSNDILLVSVGTDDDDFGPSIDEINEKFNKIDATLANFRELGKDIVTKTLSVPSAEQTHIAGPNNSTLRSLKAGVANPLEISLHQPTDDEVTVHGLTKDVASTIEEIKQVLQDAKDYAVASSYKTTLEFPTAVLSRLIGKSGAHLNSLRDEHGVRVDVAKDDAGSKPETTTVTVTGIKRNAEETKLKIIALGKSWADETTETIRVPQQYQRRLIGPKGLYVNRLQDKYNVRIKFPHEDQAAKKDEVIVKGPSKGAKKAIDELKDLLNYEIENGHKSVVSVPTAAISRIIGKSGSKLNALRDEFGVEIDIADKADSHSKVEITGTKQAIKEVEAKIKEVVNEVENTITEELEVDPKHYRAILGSNGSNLRNILSKAKAPEDPSTWYRLLVIPDKGSESHKISSTGDRSVVTSIINQVKAIVAEEENSITEELTIPQEKHRLLIGPSGSTRREIETKFNVTVMIPRISEKSDIVKIKGLSEAVESAKEHIIKVTADNWSAVIDVPAKFHAGLAQKGAVFKKLRSSYGIKVEHGQLARDASKLSNAKVSIPESARAGEGASNWTLVEDNDASVDSDAGKVIPWRLVGKEEDAAKAKKFLEQQLETISKHNYTGYLYLADRSNFSKVIGPKGATVEKIRKNTGANINIPQAHDEINDVIVVRGNKEGVEQAKEEILKLL
ncbi:Scp160 protein [Saccharomycopsis crataegensis]|uniref:Scp160 protein n=1 Tax=Saccharomycopsis crataegensis TaxID=43959 RepID=A0AAV5QRJ1_9ASCO|nr:Scp160 protein [Saccharomycopsis crataegensis]